MNLFTQLDAIEADIRKCLCKLHGIDLRTMTLFQRHEVGSLTFEHIKMFQRGEYRHLEPDLVTLLAKYHGVSARLYLMKTV